ncbi:MAG: hypothetical protein PUF12_12070 [Thermoflexaceae bacterium]|nr:hypothetical protein [Thermoflexaceae bacterium]
MGEIDVTLENYFKKNERVADVCNLAVGAKFFKTDAFSELSGNYVVAG